MSAVHFLIVSDLIYVNWAKLIMKKQKMDNKCVSFMKNNWLTIATLAGVVVGKFHDILLQPPFLRTSLFEEK